MNKSITQKYTTLLIILLFIGVSVAPSIIQSVVKASINDDLVEVTTQACGIKGYGNTTVKLTREQYQNLEEYLVEFRDRLNQTSTMEEAVPIFKDAMVELDKYGLLPRGMSVERAQRLVIGQFQSPRINQLIQKTVFRNKIHDSNTSNYFCLVSSLTDGSTFSVGPIVQLSNNMFGDTDYNLFIKLIYFLYNHGFQLLEKFGEMVFTGLVFLLSLPWLIGVFFTSINPINIFYTITLGSYLVLNFPSPIPWEEYVPATGWVDTFGLNGKKVFQNQSLWGHLPLQPISLFMYQMGYSFPGIFGFTGIQINNNETVYRLGSALWVEISSEHP